MNARPWLILSLALNVTLAGVIAWAAATRHRANGSSPAVQALTNRDLRVRKAMPESARRVVEIEPQFRWSEVESTDYRVYMANLRAIGCPERTIRDIIVADVDQLFIERLRRVIAPMSARFWWLVANMKQAEEEGERYEEQWKALEQEREAVFQELLGTKKPFRAEQDPAREAGERARQSRELDFLTPEKQQAVLALRENLVQAQHQLWQTDRQLTKEEREERQQKQRETQAGCDRQLAELLTPEELAEYRLRTSGSADVRHRLRRADFSEAELRALTRIGNARREAESAISGNSPETKQQQREAARQRAEEEIKQALGEARYAAYERAGDHRFEQIAQVTERHGMPEEKALAVYAMQREAEAQANLIRLDGTRPAEERGALLQAIRAETERSVKAALGEKAFATYQKRSGNWISSLSAPGK